MWSQGMMIAIEMATQGPGCDSLAAGPFAGAALAPQR